MSLIKDFFEKKPTLWKRWIGLGLGVFALILRYLTPPQYVEAFYSRQFYFWVRKVFDITLAWSPVPLLLVFYGIMVYFVVKLGILLFSKNRPLKQRLTEGGLKTLNFLGFMLFGFFLLWGFNYGRPKFINQLGITVQKLDTIALRQELFIAAQEAISARDTLMKQLLAEKKILSDTLSSFEIMDNFEDKMRSEVSKTLNNYHFPAKGNLRGREIKPDGLLFRFGISGIYMPYIGESSIDNALYSLEKPFTMAHEMAHGYGWTEEATANFVAYLTCIQSDDLLIRYSGYLSYYRYVASNFKREFPEAYTQFREKLPTGMKNDLKAINDRINKYPSWFDTSALNDLYLKSQGVTEGVESYSRIVVLVHSWRFR
jgi:hypothetical protein